MNNVFAAAYNRAPDWKWKRVLSILKGDGVPATPFWDTESGCEWIKRACEFKKSYDKESNPAINNELIIMYPDILSAYSMYTDKETFFRQELEAMILARMEPEALAYRADVPVAVITAYEELFFDVRRKLDNKSYIVHYVIGPEMQNLKADSYGPLWKLFGYLSGPEVLDAIITKTVNPQFALTPDAVGSRLNEDISGSFKVAAAIAAKKRGGGNQADRQLLQLFAKIMEVDKMEDLSSGSSRGQMEEHMLAAFSAAGLTVGGTNFYNPAVNTQKSGEPRFPELVEMTLKGQSESFESEDDFKFPIPKATTK